MGKGNKNEKQKLKTEIGKNLKMKKNLKKFRTQNWYPKEITKKECWKIENQKHNKNSISKDGK